MEGGNPKRRPESVMAGHGYDPSEHDGSLKAPLFQTSTFTFETAAEGKRFFAQALGQEDPAPGEKPGLIYSRLGNPNLSVVESRLCVWDGAEQGLLFASGMAAIATTMLAHLRPGDVLVHSVPVYGGTDHLIREVLRDLGIRSVEWIAGTDPAAVAAAVKEEDGPLRMVFLETPANPTNGLFDIAAAARLARDVAPSDRPALMAVDNTFLGPLWQHPIDHGADLVVYSATKYLGGHSDLVAGGVVGSANAVAPIAGMRTILGTMADPHTAWLLARSLETLNLRMRRQTESAAWIARFLQDHPVVESVSYLGLLDVEDPTYELFKRQCEGPGAMISFELRDEAEAFCFLDHLDLVELAVSLGGTESLAQHPAAMTHAGVPPEARDAYGVTDGLVRLSVGVEAPQDLIADIAQALGAVAAMRSNA